MSETLISLINKPEEKSDTKVAVWEDIPNIALIYLFYLYAVVVNARSFNGFKKWSWSSEESD
jgi:hypothetical protein